METNESTISCVEIHTKISTPTIFQKSLMQKAIKILMLEYSAQDTELIKNELKKANINFIERISNNKEAYIKELFEFQPDIVFSNDSMRFLHWDA